MSSSIVALVTLCATSAYAAEELDACRGKACGAACVVQGDMAGECDRRGKCSFNVPADCGGMKQPQEYNCLTREMWTPEKKAWCCREKQLGCPPERRPPLVANAATDVVASAATDEYKCMTKEMWTPEKQAWCCREKQLGCPHRSPSVVAAAATKKYNCMTRELWRPEKREWCCEHERWSCQPSTGSGSSAIKLVGEVINDAEVFQPTGQPQSQISSTGSTTCGVASCSTLVLVAVAFTSLFCCILGCCMVKAVCGCLFGGVEDVFDGDGKVGLTGQAEEMGVAGMAGHYLA